MWCILAHFVCIHFMKSCILKTIKGQWKKLKQQINGNTSWVNGMEDLTLLKCPYYPRWATKSMLSSSKSQWHFFYRNRKNNCKIYMEPWKTQNSQSDFMKEQSWSHHTPWLQNTLQSYSSWNNMVPKNKQNNKSSMVLV